MLTIPFCIFRCDSNSDCDDGTDEADCLVVNIPGKLKKQNIFLLNSSAEKLDIGAKKHLYI